MADTLGEIDLVNPDNYVDRVPLEWFDHLREDHPVVWHPEPEPNRGFWAVTRYDDLTAVHMNWETYSSEIGAVALEELDTEQLEIRRSMLETDPPRHTELRKICSKRFSARGVGKYEDWIREVARDVLDEALPKGEFEFVSDISRDLPIRFLCSIFTVPQEDAPQLISWGDSMIANQDPDLSAAVVDKVDTEEYRLLPFRSPTALQVFAYADRQRDMRLDEPADDVIQALTVAQSEGALNEREFHNYFALLMIAGNETTRHTISHGMLALMQHPEQLQLLREEPERIPAATEEILRWATPVYHFRRTATRDAELRGQHIRAGDKVVTWYISANFDPESFPDPRAFDVTRSPNDHVTFGPGGPHFCLGAHLARLETKILFQELIPRLETIELTGPVERIRSNFVNGIKRMPVRVTTR
ncbi:MAG: cytochrome P450 [Actinomycetota bacterium]|nr:cytochrome P450 [Actinomycetota bacterium]MDH5225141.1 cytochrome P450 [Actinomycetota bacterium]MDH5312250.1 cytochrome P450 [Actinomycetota bacterium]